MKKESYESLSAAITDLCGASVRITGKMPVSGGDINEAYALILSDRTRLFLKANRRENADFFRAEAEGLEAIESTGTITTPKILCRGTDTDFAFLLLELVESKGRKEGFFERFGQRLAAMHQADTERFVNGGRYGFLQDNYIGAGPQKNEPRTSWIAFFRECRLAPQFARADRYFSGADRTRIERLMDRLPGLLVEPERPSLLHGDLWGGNYMVGSDGEAWLIDPAAYVGCNEADLAMTELFGGFPQAFYASYEEALPLQPGYADRRDLYNLYHLLNHLNLFGGGYLSSVRGILGRYT